MVSGDAARAVARATTFSIILSLSFCHMLNDLMQSLVPALYPILKVSYGLSFGQIGVITLAFQCTASMLQPVVGLYTDRRPQPYSLTIGIGFTLVGLLCMSRATSYPAILLAAALIGMGSSVFHPEASRVARMAAGGRYGLAQSLFQVGGNVGSASGPLLAAFVVVPHGQSSIAWFAVAALVAIVVLLQIGGWYPTASGDGPMTRDLAGPRPRARRRCRRSRWRSRWPFSSRSSSTRTCAAPAWARTTHSIDGRFHLPVQRPALPVRVPGRHRGGHDRGRRRWRPPGTHPRDVVLVLGALRSRSSSGTRTVSGRASGRLIAMIMASAFSAILVYAQDLLPGRVGLISGMFYGVSFGLGGVGAAALGWLADLTSITTVYRLTPFLLLLGLLTALLPRRPNQSLAP